MDFFRYALVHILILYMFSSLVVFFYVHLFNGVCICLGWHILDVLVRCFFRRAKWFVLVTPFLPYLLHVFLAMIYSWDLLKCCRYIDVIGDDYCCHILHHLELSMAVVTSTPAYQTHLFHSRNRVFDLLQTVSFLELLQCLNLNCEE